jgi:translation initiation factor 2D
LSQEDVDSLLQDALLYAISQKLSKDSQALPMTSSKLFDTYILPSRRAAAAGHDVSIRKSSFKNASAFLKQAKKDGLISTKESKGGDLSITAVNPQHPL